MGLLFHREFLRHGRRKNKLLTQRTWLSADPLLHIYTCRRGISGLYRSLYVRWLMHGARGLMPGIMYCTTLSSMRWVGWYFLLYISGQWGLLFFKVLNRRAYVIIGFIEKASLDALSMESNCVCDGRMALLRVCIYLLISSFHFNNKFNYAHKWINQ